MRIIGFSTGALAKGDWRAGVQLARTAHLPALELSALRFQELEPLIAGLAEIEWQTWKYVSLHVPSRFDVADERRVLRLLQSAEKWRIPFIVHPDVVYTPALWRSFGNMLLIENMDKRKPQGRTVGELRAIFDALPEARFCFDIGHARQVDPSMTEASLLLRAYGGRLAEVHVSEVNTASRHDPISLNAVRAFQPLAPHIPASVPVIIESLIDQGQSNITHEVARVEESLRLLVPVA
ncbi:MAG: hypothetical protein JNK48_08610 [Bryobacterales bacterium]|nr:hypothetical protein [Bryobacterales bacterium]